MKIQFDRVFEVKIFHDYYTSGISKDFDIAPTARCQQQLRNYGLLFKKTGKGFVVLYEVVEDSVGHPHPRKPIEEDVKFSFMVQSKNPYLLNYSDLPLDSQPNQIYYLHNLHDNQQNDELLLTSDTNMSGADRCELRAQFFQYLFTSPNSREDVELLDELGHSVLKEPVNIVEDMGNYPVDLHSYPPGKFILKIAGVPKLTFYADDELIGKNIFGVIDVFRNDSVPSQYQFTDSNHDVVPKVYTVKLENRKTLWKYYVVLKYRPEIVPEDLSITYLVPPIKFDRQPVKPLSDGTPTVPFISNKELALQEKSIKGIKLTKKNGNSSGTFEIENLPNPSVTTLTPNNSDQKVYSEMFIYV